MMEGLQPLLFAIVLLVLGLGLIVLEVFIVSFGLLTILAIAALAGAIYFAFQAGALAGWLFVLAAPIAAALIIRNGIKRVAASKAVPKAEVTSDAGYRHVAERLQIAEGATGTLVTPARPTGRARFAGGECDVYAPGQTLDPGAEIVVTHIEGPTITVRATRPG